MVNGVPVRLAHQRQMEVVGRRHHNKVDVLVGQQLLVGGIGLFNAVLLGERHAFRVDVVNAGEAYAVGFENAVFMPVTHAAVADDSRFVLFHAVPHSFSLRPTTWRRAAR